MSRVWEKLMAARPLNATAAVVVSSYAGMMPEGPQVPETRQHWRSPPPLKRVGRGREDLTGRVIGRLQVIGLLGKLSPKAGSRWLVRCRCGDYEARSAKAIKNPDNQGDACINCVHHEKLKRRDRETPVRPVLTFKGEL